MGRKPGPGAQELAEEEARTCCGCRFPLLLALLQLALGIAVTVLGFLMASISPSLLVRDTPFWAGIIVCVVAYLGLFMLCVSYQVDERTCVQFSMKVSCFSCFRKHRIERNVTADKRELLKVLPIC